MCVYIFGGNVNTDYSVHSKLTSNKRFKDYPTQKNLGFDEGEGVYSKEAY